MNEQRTREKQAWGTVDEGWLHVLGAGADERTVGLQEAASVEVLFDGDSLPSVEPPLVHAATGREYLGEIELVEGKPIVTSIWLSRAHITLS